MKANATCTRTRAITSTPSRARASPRAVVAVSNSAKREQMKGAQNKTKGTSPAKKTVSLKKAARGPHARFLLFPLANSYRKRPCEPLAIQRKAIKAQAPSLAPAFRFSTGDRFDVVTILTFPHLSFRTLLQQPRAAVVSRRSQRPVMAQAAAVVSVARSASVQSWEKTRYRVLF